MELQRLSTDCRSLLDPPASTPRGQNLLHNWERRVCESNTHLHSPGPLLILRGADVHLKAANSCCWAGGGSFNQQWGWYGWKVTTLPWINVISVNNYNSQRPPFRHGSLAMQASHSSLVHSLLAFMMCDDVHIYLHLLLTGLMMLQVDLTWFGEAELGDCSSAGGQ